MLKDRFNTLTKNFKGGLLEGRDILLTYPQRFSQKSLAGKAFSVGKVIAIPTSIYLTSGTSLTAASAFGALTIGGVLTLLRMKNNKHKNALSPIIAYTNATQKFLLGGTGYATMAVIAGTRSLTMAMLPDTQDAEKLRNRVGLAFAFAGMGIIGAIAHHKQEIWELAPIGSMLLGTLASTKINDKSFQARVCHVIANTNNALYSMLYSGSAASAMIDSLGACMAGTTIAENDIPQSTRAGKPLSLSEKARAYFMTVIDSSHQHHYGYQKTPKLKTPITCACA